MFLDCDQCGERFESAGKRGPTPKRCSARCRQRASRERRKSPVPVELRRERRWIRCDEDKRPVGPRGALKGWNRSDRWMDYVEASRSAYGAGNGFVLGDGIGCIDLDNCVYPDGSLSLLAENVLRQNPGTYVELSQSGRGLHVFGYLAGVNSRRPGLEVYSSGRYIWVTGDVYRAGSFLKLVV